MLRALNSVLNEVNSDHSISCVLKFSYSEKKKKYYFHFILISEKISLGSKTVHVRTLKIMKCF